MKVALYARHSDDKQNPRSSSDQLAALRPKALARGFTVIASFSDEAISGAAVANRPGVRALLRGAAAGDFDIVLTEALDRLSRDQEGTAHIFKRLTYAGVELETLSEGRVDELHVGLKGTMNQLFLAELGRKTRRGLVAKVKAGFSGGGRCYGYRVADKGVLIIDETEALIVVRIATSYAAGESPRAIAHALNREGVAGPRGGEWTASTIHGDRRAQDGILHQELSIGVRVFNRRRYRKHPDTGRRSSVLNPPEEWIREPVPELRIIADDLWAAVQARKKAVSEHPASWAKRPKRLLSGLLRCAVCGSGMSLNGGRYQCTGHKERGTFTNGKIIAAKRVEERVVAGVREHLLAPEAIAQAVRDMRESDEAERRAALAERAPMERELAEIARRLQRAQSMCLDGAIDTAELKTLSEPMKARRGEVQLRLDSATQPPSPVQLHPQAAEAYRRLAADLHGALERKERRT